MLHNFKINGGLYMLYLDYAKKKENGYILNFFADSYDDLEEVSDGKEYITLNGVNYGVPMAESVVTITNKNGEKTTYVMGGDGQWVQGDVDISNYYTKEQSDEKFATKESVEDINLPHFNTLGTGEYGNYVLKDVTMDNKTYSVKQSYYNGVPGSQDGYIAETLTKIYVPMDNKVYNISGGESVKVNVTSTTEGNRYEFANMMVGTNIYELPEQPIFNYSGSAVQLTKSNLNNVVVGNRIYYINQPSYNLGGSAQGTPLESIYYNETKYDVPVVVSEDGKNISGLLVGNTKYNVASGTASGPEIVLLEGGKPTADVNGNYSLRLNTDLSDDEQGALTKRFRTGEVIIRIHCTDNTYSYTYDVNFIEDLSFTQGDNATGTWYVNFVVTDRESHKSTIVPCWVKYRD